MKFYGIRESIPERCKSRYKNPEGGKHLYLLEEHKEAPLLEVKKGRERVEDRGLRARQANPWRVCNIPHMGIL